LSLRPRWYGMSGLEVSSELLQSALSVCLFSVWFIFSILFIFCLWISQNVKDKTTRNVCQIWIFQNLNLYPIYYLYAYSHYTYNHKWLSEKCLCEESKIFQTFDQSENLFPNNLFCNYSVLVNYSIVFTTIITLPINIHIYLDMNLN